MGTLLKVGGKEIGDPAAEDIAAALRGPRDNDWFLTLHRGEDDYMDVMVEAGEFWVECEEGGTFLQARSYVDDAMVQEMLLAFRDGGAGWRDLAAWAEPPKASKQKVSPQLLAIIAGAAAVAIGLVVTALVTGNGAWVVVLFALAFPGVIAVAALVKQAELARAASWTKANARIVRSGMVRETRYDKEVTVPRVEYEYTVGFHRYRGRRASFAERVAGLQAKEMLARYPVGAGVPAYYNPADPTESVLERDPPPFLRALWIFVGVLTALVIAGTWWFLLR